ncbi:MAG: hypothetical protein RL129_581 [Actinomycetota bacterium]|jgi:1-phosphofructokinase
MILTITLSPTFDLSYQVKEIIPNAVNRVGKKSFETSGKGINVSINLAEAKIPTIAIAPIPETLLGELWINMATENMVVRTSKSSHEVRINTSINSDGGTTKINESFEKLADDELKDLISVVTNEAKAHKPSWIALCGSVHPDNAKFLGESLRKLCNEVSAKFAVDTSGESAQILFDFGPDFIKPNRDELRDWYPESAKSEDAYVAAIRDLAKRIDGTVLCTDGGKTAYATDNKNLLEIVPPTIAAVNSVGAGDASLAGYLAAESSGSDFVTAVTTAMKWAIASCLNPQSAGLNLKAASGFDASVRELVR